MGLKFCLKGARAGGGGGGLVEFIKKGGEKSEGKGFYYTHQVIVSAS